MKNWKKAATGFLAVSMLAAGLACPIPAGAAAVNQKEAATAEYKTGAVFSSSRTEAMRLAAKQKALSQYYITSGRKLNKAVSLLEAMPPEKTGLDAAQSYFYRMDKELTGKYFYHVKAFTPDMETLVGEYFLAKDTSCVFRRFPENNSIDLLDGTTETLLKKVEIMPASVIIPLKSSGKVLVRVPGGLPYDLTLTSLTENIATIKEENGQLLISGNARGYADVLAEVEIGGYVKAENFVLPSWTRGISPLTRPARFMFRFMSVGAGAGGMIIRIAVRDLRRLTDLTGPAAMVLVPAAGADRAVLPHAGRPELKMKTGEAFRFI